MNIDDDYGLIVSNLITESIDDNTYEEVAQALQYRTDGFSKLSGTYVCNDLYTAKLAYAILNEVYDDVEIVEGDTDEKAFIVKFSQGVDYDEPEVEDDDQSFKDDDYNESLNEASIVDKKGGTKLKRNKDMTFRANPAGGIDFFNSHINGGSSSGEGATDGGFSAGGGEGGGVGESWEDEDEPTLCPECGRDMHRIEGAGNDWLYKCNDCGDYYLLDKDNKLTLAEDVKSYKNNLLKFCNEADLKSLGFRDDQVKKLLSLKAKHPNMYVPKYDKESGHWLYNREWLEDD